MRRIDDVQQLAGVDCNHTRIWEDNAANMGNCIDIYRLPADKATNSEAGYVRVAIESFGYMGAGEGWDDVSLDYYKCSSDDLRRLSQFNDYDFQTLKMHRLDLQMFDSMKLLHSARIDNPTPDYPEELVAENDAVFEKLVSDRSAEKPGLFAKFHDIFHPSSPREVDSRLLDGMEATSSNDELSL